LKICENEGKLGSQQARGASMEWILQTLMMMGAKAASIFISPDSPNFEVVQGMMAILALVACVLLITFAFRKK
jgi:hypothetical protein